MIETLPSPQLTPLARASGILMLVLAPPLLLSMVYSDALQVVPLAWYMPFHTLAEVLAVVVAASIFITGWHIHDEKRPRASVMLACAFLAVALLDYAHLMSYQGMPDFITPNSPHKAIYFWLAARLIAAGALLIYVLLPHASKRMTTARGWLLSGSLVGAGLLIVVGISHSEWLPATYEQGQGLTTFKRVVEGLVVVMHAATLVLIWRRRDVLVIHSLGALTIAVALMTVSELFFMLYFTVHDLPNALGHAYKVVAYLFLYRAMFLDSVRAPIERLGQVRLELQEGARRLRELLENAPDAVLVADEDGRIQMVNERLEALFGYTRLELFGQPVEILLPDSVRERHRHQRVHHGRNPVERPMAAVPNLVGRRKDGSEVPVDIALSRFDCDDGCRITAFIRDVTERRQLELELQHRATHDALTGLPNRVMFHDRLERAMLHARRNQRLAAVMLLDLDNFKAINDVWGHIYGDRLLQEVARRLTAALRAEDTVARLGGDEFAILLADLEQAADATKVADKLLAALAGVFSIESSEVYANASIGVTVFPVDGEDADTLLRNADMTMYRAKSGGRGCAQVYTPDLNDHMRDFLILQGHIRNALARDQFRLHYQPQVDLASGEICGVEALIRWQHPELGEISPARFIPVAEASGLIVPIGDWVIAAACAQIAAWQQAGTPIRVAVNLSAHQFRQGQLVSRVQTELVASGAPAHLLELELTETTLMEDPQTAVQTFQELERLGVFMAIDDFGTGYSSLAYLKQFHLHRLKLDSSFIRELASDPDDAAIVRGVISLGHSLGFKVIAEGVETEEQRRMLERLGCDEFQGWLFSRALPAEACAALLAQGLQREALAM